MITDRAQGWRVTIVVMAAVALVILLASTARADDCPPRIPPSQVNCDEARGYVEAIGLRASIRKALRCGYGLREIAATVRRCGLK